MISKVEYQYILTCPECGGVSNSYSERILHPAEIDKLEAELNTLRLKLMTVYAGQPDDN